MRSIITALAASLVVAAANGSARPATADPYVDAVREFRPGTFAGFGAQELPDIVLGPPEGLGPLEGSTHVVSLGNGGEITVVFRNNVVYDGPGDDLVIFENAFHSGAESGPVFSEFAFVQVSADRKSWHEFPVDEISGAGLAGRTPVLANSENGLDPLAASSGGDRFDLDDVGLTFIRYVRLVDADQVIDDPGNHVAPADKGGFDLDAVGAIHSTPPGSILGTIAAAGLPVARARVSIVPEAGGRKLRRRTRADGTFRFARVVPSGDYLVSARRRRVGEATMRVYVDMAQLVVDVDLRLE